MKLKFFREQDGKQELRSFMKNELFPNRIWTTFSHPLDKVYVEKLKVLNLEDKSESIISTDEFDKSKYKIIAFYVSGKKSESSYEFFCICNEWMNYYGGVELLEENILEIESLSEDAISESDDWLNERLKYNYIERSKKGIADQNEYNEILEFFESHELYMEAAGFILSRNDYMYEVYRDGILKSDDVIKYVLEEYCQEHGIELEKLKESLNDSRLECIINQMLLLTPDSKINLNDYIQGIIGRRTDDLNIPEKEVYPKFVEIEDGLIPFYEYRKLDHGEIKGIYFTNSEEYDESTEFEWGYCNFDYEKMADIEVLEQRVTGTLDNAIEEFANIVYKNSLRNIAQYLKSFDLEFNYGDDPLTEYEDFKSAIMDVIMSCSSEIHIIEDKYDGEWNEIKIGGKVGHDSYIICEYDFSDIYDEFDEGDSRDVKTSFNVYLIPNYEKFKSNPKSNESDYCVLSKYCGEGYWSPNGTTSYIKDRNNLYDVELDKAKIDSFFGSLMEEEIKEEVVYGAENNSQKSSEDSRDDYAKFATAFELQLYEEKAEAPEDNVL